MILYTVKKHAFIRSNLMRTNIP